MAFHLLGNEAETKDATQETFLDVRFASSREYTFEVSAKGTEAAGEYPNIKLPTHCGSLIVIKTKVRYVRQPVEIP